MSPTRRLSLAGSWISFWALRKTTPMTPDWRESVSSSLTYFAASASPASSLMSSQREPAGRERRLADQRRAFFVHLEEKEIGDLRDIGLIGDALIAQHMREIPDLGDESFGVHVGSSSRAGRPRRRGEASGVASRASSALAGSSAGSCGTRRPSKEAFKIDCLRRAASPVSASSSFSASSAAANASETRRRISNASEVGGSGTGSRLNLDMLIEARFVVCLPCSMKKRRPISFA